MFFKVDTSTDEWIRCDLGTYSHLIIFNDGATNYIAISTNGSSIDGVIFPNEGIEFRDLNESTIFVKSYTSGLHSNFRLWCYGQGLNQQLESISINNITVPKNINSNFERNF
jgi:hypothetical protein